MIFTFNTAVLLSTLYVAGMVEFAISCHTAPIASED